MANTPHIDLVKPAGTDKALISVINANSDKIDSAVGGVQDALAIVCNGNTHGAITSGQYVYVRAHETLQEGLYKANSNIAANAALNSTNLTADSAGGLNALNEQIGNIKMRRKGHTFSVSANGSYYTNLKTLVDSDLPSGYKVIALAGYECGYAEYALGSFAYADNNFSLVIKDLSGQGASNVTFNIYYLCMPS